MAQVQGPPPSITEVISSNATLLCKWENDPYSNSNDATLLIINTDANTMASILLNADQIAAEEYAISGLVNGANYALLFSILANDGTTHNSNTVYGIPSDIPQPPTIVSYAIQPGFTTVSVVATLGLNGGSPITKLVFRVLQEGGVITSQAFNVNSNNTYPLAGFSQNSDYIVSCQAQNVAGYSNVSNSIAFRNSYVPATPVLGTVTSGVNQAVSLPISGTNDTNAQITGFNLFYKLESSSSWTSFGFVSYPITTNTYSVNIPNLSPPTLALTNTSAYNFKVQSVNSYGPSLDSNISNAVPALKLAFSSAAVTFTGSNQINATWAVNAASWAGSGTTTVNFYSGASLLGSVGVASNAVAASYTLSPGSLVAGASYSVTINGYNIVPQSLYPTYWVAPVLTNYEFNADQVSASSTYATVPGAVSNILYQTDIVDPSNNLTGQIQFSWTAAPANGSPITNYSCQLYTVANGARTVIGSAITTSATNCLFTGLNTTLFYAVGIIANNSIGAGPVTYLPNTTAYGIVITDAVPPVTNLTGVQVSYDGSAFSGRLSWNYSGPGTGYTNASFKVYSIVSGVETLLDSISYVSGTSAYQYNVALGSNANITYNYVVRVSAQSGANLSTSVGVYVSITTGLAPIISDVVIGPNGVGGAWTLTFKITNNTTSSMIPGSCTSIVMPSPVTAILPSPSGSSVNPVYSGYNLSLVPQEGYFVFTRVLGYTAISPDYCTIVCANEYGGAVFNALWGN